jgi:hypothetical protein
MTERDWLEGTDPAALLLGHFGGRGRACARKLRLFAVACCRRLWEFLPDERSRRSVEAAERYADGAASAEELHTAAALAGAAHLEAFDVRGKVGASVEWAAVFATDAVAFHAAKRVQSACVLARTYFAAAAAPPFRRTFFGDLRQILRRWLGAEGGEQQSNPYQPYSPTPEKMEAAVRAGDAEKAAQCELLRELVGNPFRPTPALEARWLAWSGGVVVALARAAYDESRFNDLPIIADALEEAGCGHPALLAHLRGPGPHARGCWALDRLLDRV